VQQAGDGKNAALQMALFEAVVAEFAPDTASAMHMPWDFHNRCRAIFQARPSLSGTAACASLLALDKA
jgi:hypothetical protein